jgi:hypothetical protein
MSPQQQELLHSYQDRQRAIPALRAGAAATGDCVMTVGTQHIDFTRHEALG